MAKATPDGDVVGMRYTYPYRGYPREVRSYYDRDAHTLGVYVSHDEGQSMPCIGNITQLDEEDLFALYQCIADLVGYTRGHPR